MKNEKKCTDCGQNMKEYFSDICNFLYEIGK